MKYKVLSVHYSWDLCVREMQRISIVLDKCGFQNQVNSIGRLLSKKGNDEIDFLFLSIEGLKSSPQVLMGFNQFVFHTTLGGFSILLNMLSDDYEKLKHVLHNSKIGDFEIIKDTIYVKIRDSKTIMFEKQIVDNSREID